ncbi:MAG: DUF1573 domain-containing protein [Mediterranea sp.]|nr:DUF1573 domain-containing protein [Mediterranea sp.]
MKSYLFTLYILTVTGMTAWAQPRISVNRNTYSCGQVEWLKPVMVDFTITNTGDKPLELANVIASCACAAPGWTQTSIAPGGNGAVSITFDAKALGRFHKSIGIYSNAESSPIYLHITGEVVRETTNFEKNNLKSIGQILIDKTEIDFPNVHKGERPTLQLTIINQSPDPYEPILMHLPPYLQMAREPRVLQKGEKGIVTLTLDTDRLPDLGLIQTSVYLARFAGDKVGDQNEIPVSIVLLPDFSDLSEAERMNAPAIHFSQTDVDLSEQLKKKRKAVFDIIVSNTGKSILHINKLQVFNAAVDVGLNKSVLTPGEQARLRITLEKPSVKKKNRKLRILLISNDPVQPKSIIRLKAE